MITVDIKNQNTLDRVNSLIADVTASPTITPYIAWERVGKVLVSYHIFLPRVFLEGSVGNQAVAISQFGERMGMTNDGETKVVDNSELFLYFEWMQNEMGDFEIFAEIVDEHDLQELLADYDADTEEELKEETVLSEISAKLAGRAWDKASDDAARLKFGTHKAEKRHLQSKKFGTYSDLKKRIIKKVPEQDKEIMSTPSRVMADKVLSASKEKMKVRSKKMIKPRKTKEIAEERSEKRNWELVKTRSRILDKVTDRINKKDPHLSHPAGYAKRGMKVVKKIDKALEDKS